MNEPFTVFRKDGLVYVESRADAAFRKALMDGVPTSLRSKMQEALAVIPHKGTAAHCKRYFGDELPSILEQIAPLIVSLNKYLSERGLRGFFDWLKVTGLGNDYRMVKVFKAWSEMPLSGPKPTIERALRH